jgi:hypothetical protein
MCIIISFYCSETIDDVSKFYPMSGRDEIPSQTKLLPSHNALYLSGKRMCVFVCVSLSSHCFEHQHGKFFSFSLAGSSLLTALSICGCWGNVGEGKGDELTSFATFQSSL